MSTKDAYVLIFLDFKNMWVTLKKSIISKIGGFDGTRPWKCILAGFFFQ